jgi:hypothetical protein
MQGREMRVGNFDDVEDNAFYMYEQLIDLE